MSHERFAELMQIGARITGPTRDRVTHSIASHTRWNFRHTREREWRASNTTETVERVVGSCRSAALNLPDRVTQEEIFIVHRSVA